MLYALRRIVAESRLSDRAKLRLFSAIVRAQWLGFRFSFWLFTTRLRLRHFVRRHA